MHFLLRTKESLLQKDSLQMEMFILVQLFYDYHSNLVHSKKVSARVFPKTHKKKHHKTLELFLKSELLLDVFFKNLLIKQNPGSFQFDQTIRGWWQDWMIHGSLGFRKS